jgi:hypothetical protein
MQDNQVPTKRREIRKAMTELMTFRTQTSKK